MSDSESESSSSATSNFSVSSANSVGSSEQQLRQMKIDPKEKELDLDLRKKYLHYRVVVKKGQIFARKPLLDAVTAARDQWLQEKDKRNKLEAQTRTNLKKLKKLQLSTAKTKNDLLTQKRSHDSQLAIVKTTLRSKVQERKQASETLESLRNTIISRQRQLDDVVNTIDRVRAGLPTGVGLPSPRNTERC